MKLDRLRQLQAATLVMLVCYAGMLYYILREAPHGQPMWSQAMAERRIASDQSMQALQSDIRDATQNFSQALHVEHELLLVFFVSTCGMICFLGWSAFKLARIKREVQTGHES